MKQKMHTAQKASLHFGGNAWTEEQRKVASRIALIQVKSGRPISTGTLLHRAKHKIHS